MRVRDIQLPGYYARVAQCQHENDPQNEGRNKVTFKSIHVVGFAPLLLIELMRIFFIPIVEDEHGGCDLVRPNTLFQEENDWSLLCDGSEPGFGPHSFLVQLLKLAGYDDEHARRIARETLIEALDRQIYGYSGTPRTTSNAGNER